jgi:delta-aminolevulinic acid dehydratase/porphobilinogen synthase
MDVFTKESNSPLPYNMRSTLFRNNPASKSSNKLIRKINRANGVSQYRLNYPVTVESGTGPYPEIEALPNRKSVLMSALMN